MSPTEPSAPRGRESALVTAFVRLADTLAADYDVIEVLHGLCIDCVTLFALDAAGLLLADQRGGLAVAASSSEQAHLVELFQIQSDEGPCLDSYATSSMVTCTDLEGEGIQRWPMFASRAVAEGYRSVHALPLRLRTRTIGALNLFAVEPGSLPADDLHSAQALADVATIGVLHERTLADQQMVNEQLQGALNSRIIIEQAKGVLSVHGDLDMDTAFEWLRRHARRTNQRLSQLAADVVSRRAHIPDVLAGHER
jgi:transcriptional regulator with GAF, ATPase, and Fis domain